MSVNPETMLNRGDLKQVEGLGESGIEFLAAVGVEDLGSLARSNGPALQQEISQANAILRIDQTVPELEAINHWIEQARKKLPGGYDEPEVVKLAEVYEAVGNEVLPAIPVPGSLIKEQKISISDVPPMEDFVEVQVAVATAPIVQTGRRESNPALSKLQVREVASSRNAQPKPKTYENPSEDDDQEVRPRRDVKPLVKSPGRDLRKTASAELNEGKKLHSRRFIRGVLHPQPLRVHFAAILSLITLILFPATFVAGTLILVYKNAWLALIPLAFFVFGMLYLLYARGLKCRICGQPLFAPKACHRHIKAHHVPLIGYIFPTSLHILFFHWFRCMYCGTSVRLKE